MKVYSSLSQIQADLATNTVSCGQLVAHYLENIAQKNQLLNVFLEVYDQEAPQKATEIDKKIANGTAGRLAGMVLGIKDVLCQQDHGLQGGSKILDGFVSQFTATAVQRILDEDAIIIGRQNCDEFAMGSSNENSAFGPVRNAADPSRVPGGSSGASAVAVQADMCLASLGSDTGGSVRQPAAFCGVVGLKPTYGRVSRWGLIAYGSSFDCIGSITKNVADAALLLEIMAGADDFDSTVSSKDVAKYSQLLDQKTKSLRIGYLREGIESEGVQPAIRAQTRAMLDHLTAQGHQIEAVDFSLLPYLLPTYYILTTAEASSNLSRYDGVRYGFRSPNGTDLESLYKKTRSEGFGNEVKRRILLGTFVLSASYYDAYYTKAQQVRQLIKEQTDLLFEKYDFLVMPTTPTTAFKIGEKSENPLQMYLADIFTVQANVVGYPALSIPNGTDNQGLPIGFQVMGRPFEEEKLLAFAQSMAS
ncbi:MAG: Asp-tRNA(Asn)/Glu-tRNA(Gln) amidotransferase subunit GatA [Cytophagales bacterium]|nr:MAG: Asp-tRNA(Asn)/Glu-tRNA(Gln) amidotransferase subunit GatA [Cytophagales bacterium]